MKQLFCKTIIINPLKILQKSIVASLLFVALPACAANFDSSYTSIKETDCKTLTSSEIESIQACQKFADIQVMAVEGGLRQSLILKRGGKEYPLNFWNTVTSNPSILGSKIEWRHEKGKPTNIVGIITRLNVSENTANPDKKTSYLVVSKLTVDEVCVVGKIPTQANQNQKARIMVEKSANMPCVYSSSSQSFVKGNIVYNGNTSLPENAQVIVKINDVSRQDVASVTIGEYKTSGVSSFPIPFKIGYLPSKIKRGFRYTVSTDIEKNGKLLFTNDTRISVFQNGSIDKRDIKLPVIKIGRY